MRTRSLRLSMVGDTLPVGGMQALLHAVGERTYGAAMNLECHLTAVLPATDPVGRGAVRWAEALSERAGEPVPYAFALAIARHERPSPLVRSAACAPRAMSLSPR